MHRFLLELTSSDFDHLDLFAVFDENELRMKKTTFEYAIKRMGLRQNTIDSVYRVLVKGEPRQKVIDETGINEGHLSKTISNIYKSLKEKCEADGLVITDEYIIKQDHVVALETLKVLESEALYEVSNKKRRSRRKAKAPEKKV